MGNMGRKNRVVGSCRVLIVVAGLMLFGDAEPRVQQVELRAAADKNDEYFYSGEYDRRLRYYRGIYSDDIFTPCYRSHVRDIVKMGHCLRKQQKIKDSILARTQRQLGTLALAQAVYDECLDYHPWSGLGRVATCIDTRLVLRARVEDLAIERQIYRKCETKWRKQPKAIDGCCRHEGRYYQESGELRDW